MASRRPLLCTLVAAVAAFWLFRAAFAPAFAGVPLGQDRQPRTAARASEICEIFVTNPS
eukprot:CAMPEP_0179125112 /NCGR_PEP_ID=MMETSP0796-20121207/59155_1 /TAXON_ID=73915 /ORGANISM="Pyrodinium bahamense, Strain pbaha01" /LENGTH=58 /DNA_ID=CAMNT_0020823799 /DNA_START=1 /DNA_END=173 /DNA_ORIENTATION=-